MQRTIVPITIVEGKHNELKSFISDLLRNYPELSRKNIDKLLTDEHMIEFKKAFTSPSVNPNFNYEFYEMLGDSTANNCIVWYFHRRFFPKPEEITTSKGTMTPLAIMGRLKQEGASVRKFSKFSRELGFQPYITMTNIEESKPTKVLEDVFEAFFGAMCYLFDSTEEVNCGYNIVSFIIKNLVIEHKILDRISVDPKDLEDPGTMLKEIYDTLRNVNKENTYEFKKDTEVDPLTSKFRVTLVLTYVQDGVKKTHNFSDIGFNMKELRKKLSRTALLFLENEYKIKWDYKTKK